MNLPYQPIDFKQKIALTIDSVPAEKTAILKRSPSTRKFVHFSVHPSWTRGYQNPPNY